MKFIAKYQHRRHAEPEYFRTITNADSLNEALRIAEKFTRKGYICVGVTTN